MKPIDGWFTEHYGGLSNDGSAVQADGFRKPWQRHNTRKLDAIREEIETLNLSYIQKAVAITSLILALDSVDNSLGHYCSYLRQWSPRSYKEMMLKVPQLSIFREKHQVFRNDIFELLPKISVDLAYFDPPYGSNNEKMPPSRVRYSSYYHIWTSVCLFDKPKLFGRANRREDTSDVESASIFEEFRKDKKTGHFIAVNAIERLISKTNARWIILSYSSGGRATAKELNDVLQSNGTLLDVVEVNHKKNVMANMRWTNEWVNEAEEPNTEFLFLLEKRF